jgi:Flp pilus assembly protein TadB
MDDTTTFDRQLGDVCWMITIGLCADYPLKQVFEALSKELPEPAVSAFKRLHADLSPGLSLDQALANLQRVMPSKHLADMLVIIQAKRQGWETANLLEDLSEQLIAQVGIDPALYTAMQLQAEALRASVPERIE